MSSAVDGDLAALVRSFRGRRCLVVGDVMLDIFERGRAVRLTPDAPAPIITDVRVTSSPGGSANVAANLAALGTEVTLLSAVGDDAPGVELLKRLAETEIRTGDVVRCPDRAEGLRKEDGKSGGGCRGRRSLRLLWRHSNPGGSRRFR